MLDNVGREVTTVVLDESSIQGASPSVNKTIASQFVDS